MAGNKVTRGRAPNGQLRSKANRAVDRFLKSNPAPIGAEFWREHDVSVHGFYMFMAGYRVAQRDQRAAKKGNSSNSSASIAVKKGASK